MTQESNHELESTNQVGVSRDWIQLGVNIGFTLMMALVAWLFQQVIVLRSNVDEVMASRFTAKDGLELWREIGKIRQEMAVMPTREDVIIIRDRQHQVLERLSRIETILMNKGMD